MSDYHFSTFDWNGDGRIDSWDDACFSSMVTMQVQEKQREERIAKMVRAISREAQNHQQSSYCFDDDISDTEELVIDSDRFEELCRWEGFRMSDFDQSELDEIQRRLERM